MIGQIDLNGASAKRLHRMTMAALLSVSGIAGGHANNIQVTNTSLTPQGKIRFDITWENSWRSNSAPANWDAAWIFVKFYDADSGYWRHAHLASDGHTEPGGVDFDNGTEFPDQPVSETNRVVGIFLYRSGSGSGTLSANNAELRWDYALDDVSYGAIDSVKVFAIEMVYVLQGSFTLGSGGTEEGHFYSYPNTSDTYVVNSEGEISVGQSAGSLYYGDSVEFDDHFGDHGTPIPDAFPKGHADFYMMKHEIAQQDYVDFLNTLTRAQQDVRTGVDLAPNVTVVGNRYVMSNNDNVEDLQGIRCDETIPASGPVTFYCDLSSNGIGGEAADGQWLACNYLFWFDLAAYLDWCGLRPMTELEFVKAARGPLEPVVDEYVWGGTGVVQATGVNNGGTINESCSTPGANALYGHLVGGWSGGMRVGVFAGNGTDRVQAGAGYYGVLDLSGGLWERVVSVGREQGRLYQGRLGDGALDSSGNPTNADWPTNSYGGSGLLGGSFFAASSQNDPTLYPEYIGYMRTSDRNTAAHTPNIRNKQHGGRGVRDAPQP